MSKIFRRTVTAFFIVVCLFTAAAVSAEVQTFDGEGKYIMSDFETREIAQQRAQQRAERDAQKKAGVYLKTFSHSVNSELTDEEIFVVTNNIISLSDVNSQPEIYEHDGEALVMYTVSLKVQVDTDGIHDWLKRGNEEKINIFYQNKDVEDALTKNDEHIAILKEQYKNAVSQSERDKIKDEIKVAERDFLADQKLKEGNKLYYQGDYEGAIKFYNEVLALGDYVGAYNNRGIAYINLNQHDRAIQDFNKVLQVSPKYDLGYYVRGFAYATLKNYELSFADFNKAISLNPKFGMAYVNRGVVYQNYFRNNEKALADFEKALMPGMNVPQFYMPLVYVNRGSTYYSFNEPMKALTDFSEALKINPNFTMAYVGRATVYGKFERYKQAFDDFDKAIELEPDYFGIYKNRGMVYLQRGEIDKALNDLNKAVELEPKEAEIYSARGLIYAQLEKYALAVSDFNKAIELNPNFGLAYYLRAYCWQMTGTDEKAKADLKMAKRLGFDAKKFGIESFEEG